MIVHPQQQNDTLALLEILSLLDRSVAEYNAVAGEVRLQLDRIAKARAALGALRRRLVGMSKALKGWERQVWDMGSRREITHEARENAKARIHTYQRALEDLTWELFDFREMTGGDQP